MFFSNTCVCVLNHFSRVPLFVTPRIVAHQAPLSMWFFRQEYWSGLPCPPPRDLPHQGSPVSPALQVASLPLSHQGTFYSQYITSNSLTPRECPIIQLSSDTISLVIVPDPPDEVRLGLTRRSPSFRVRWSPDCGSDPVATDWRFQPLLLGFQ